MSSAAHATTRVGFASLTREIARGGIAGLLAGLLVAGVGGRIAMRISSLLDPSARRFRTEAGATVGEFTLGGTLGLVIFVGLFGGIFLAVIWVIVRPWLPKEGFVRYGAAGIGGVAMLARGAVEGRNRDFIILDPPVAQAAIFIVLAAVAGIVVLVIDGWLERKLPPASATPSLYVMLSGLGLLLAGPTFFQFFSTETCSCASPPRLTGVLLVGVAAATAAGWATRGRGSEIPTWLSRAGAILSVAMVISGLAHLFGEIAHFV